VKVFSEGGSGSRLIILLRVKTAVNGVVVFTEVHVIEVCISVVGWEIERLSHDEVQHVQDGPEKLCTNGMKIEK
jgi:hypothetical protein